MKLWGGRFQQATDALVDEFTASIHFDQQLALFDIEGSLGHVKMLGQCQIVTKDEVEKISQGLLLIAEKIKQDEMEFHLADEDIHMNIERHLHQIIGPVAGKLHTGRSRNDQVALDMHLYLRHSILSIIQQLLILNEIILVKAEAHVETIMPGYTHLQRAEPIRFAHHLMAYFNMFSRDIDRLMSSWPRVNISPLGAGALAGSAINIDREYFANLLNFEGIYANSLDAVSDRDFVVEFQSNAAMIMMHLSKLSEEIILWCTQEFGFIELDDAFSTGSSMLPQKKNPDVAELTRAKTGRVYGSLMGILTVLKALPLAYNKDLQEDKEGLFDSVKTVQKTLSVFSGMLNTMRVNSEKMQTAANNDYSNAIQISNYLVRKGMPFRETHTIVGKIVLYAISEKLFLNAISLEKYKEFSELFEQDLYGCIEIQTAIESHSCTGGTAKTSVLQQIEGAKHLIQNIKNWLTLKRLLDVRGSVAGDHAL